MSFGGGTNFGAFTAKTFTLVPSAVGDIIVVHCICETQADYASAISSSNVAWDASPAVPHTNVGGTEVTTVFKGKVTAASSATVTITTAAGSPTIRGFWTEFSTTAGYANVALDTSGTVAQTGTAPPSLTPGHGAGGLYCGFQFNTGTGTAGSTSGYTYEVDANGNVAMWNVNCTSSAQSPTIGGGGDLGGAAILLYETATALTGQATLTVTPTMAAAAQHGHADQATLTETPGFNVQHQHGATAGASLSPALSAAAAASATTPPFPQVPLDLQCQLNLNGWTDITASAYQRDGTQAPVVITRGRPDQSTQANPSSCAFQLNNRSGDFSPKNPVGPYFGLLGRNTPVRWSVPAAQNYMRLEANDADRAFVSDDSNLHVSGSIDMRIELKLTDWRGCVLAQKFDGGAHGSWYWLLNADGTLTFAWVDSGDAFHSVTSSQAAPYAPGTFALRAAMDATTGNVTFYTSTSIGGTWAQLGSVSSGTGGAATSILVETTSALTVGYAFSLSPAQLFGGVHEYQLYSGIAGTLVADGIFTAQAAGATSWVDAQANTWDLSGGAEISSRNYRYHGEMSQLPPRWDVTGSDMWVAAQAGGPLRRLQQGTNNAMSAMKRAILAQAAGTSTLAYWPMEDSTGASFFGPAVGQFPMQWGVNAPTLATDSSFIASAPLPDANQAQMTGQVASVPVTNTWTVRWLGKLGTLPGSGRQPLMTVVSSGTAALVILYAYADGNLGLAAYAPGGAVLADSGEIPWTGTADPLLYSVEAVQSGGNITYSVVTVAPGATTGLAANLTTMSGAGGGVLSVGPNPFGFFTDTVFGHCWVAQAWASLFDLGQPLNAWTGEAAASRYARLAGENGYAVRILGSPAASAAMGPQAQGTLQALLQEVETADMGQVFEPRQQLALGYRTLASMCSQAAPVLTLDYSQSEPGGVNGSAADSGLDPTWDDTLSKNDWTVTRGAASGTQGATLQVQLNDGSAMSVGAPPNGIGDYANTQTANVLADTQLPDVGGWLVHIGTVNELRWPLIPANLARPETTALQQAALQLDVGDLLEVPDAPDLVVYDAVQQLALGFKESLGGFHWTLEFNAVPASPYDVIILDDLVLGRVDTDGSSLAAGVSSTATTLSVATAGTFPAWTTSGADFPFDIAIAGERITVTNITGSSSPQSFTVTRSVNGVVKSQSAGADVRLWTPTILAVT